MVSRNVPHYAIPQKPILTLVPSFGRLLLLPTPYTYTHLFFSPNFDALMGDVSSLIGSRHSLISFVFSS